MEQHRGTLILVLGIVSLVACQILGIVPWIMANGDLQKMAAGTMDPEGEGMTKAGKICGLIAVILAVIAIVGTIAMFALGVGFAAMAPELQPQ
mgnify:CR=1 FL=1